MSPPSPPPPGMTWERPLTGWVDVHLHTVLSTEININLRYLLKCCCIGAKIDPSYNSDLNKVLPSIKEQELNI